ncbi:hypothetical protein GCM10009764_29690 [Nocardia ninae]|uniref:Uncharacterized protein n=1 Tax=Nocardia ninae NBRC 108245 TaxID=1210091 RepID=A0A511MFE8_9NOCA|nr:hypothetical protein NN4_39010 [Nocardia ninae NBRC 108245]
MAGSTRNLACGCSIRKAPIDIGNSRRLRTPSATMMAGAAIVACGSAVNRTVAVAFGAGVSARLARNAASGCRGRSRRPGVAASAAQQRASVRRVPGRPSARRAEFSLTSPR